MEPFPEDPYETKGKKKNILIFDLTLMPTGLIKEAEMFLETKVENGMHLRHLC